MKRRTFIKAAAGAPVASALSGGSAAFGADCGEGETSGPPASLRSRAAYVPGYWPDTAHSQGLSARFHPDIGRNVPTDYDGPVRLLTRLGFDGSLKQAVFPVFGHDVAISPDGSVGFFGSLEYENFVSFDPQTLDLIAIGRPLGEGWIGGGHGLYLDDGKVLTVTERAPKTGYLGTPEQHHGRISFRDPVTLAETHHCSSHGISPHDIRAIDGGRYVAIAHYGSTYPAGKRSYGLPRHIVEPSIAIVEAASGKLVEKILTGTSGFELRHLCPVDRQTLFAIQVDMQPDDLDEPFRENQTALYEKDLTTLGGESYFPAPMVKVAGNNRSAKALGTTDQQIRMRQGISIARDDEHGQVIATYPSSQRVLIFDESSGDVIEEIATDELGLDYPCGVAVLGDTPFFVITGHWKNMFVFRRGSGELVRDLCHYTTFFGHSHICVA
ncbi:MAG: DUF1513 domain-containing protein [Pseudomonadota bacterium]